MILTEQEKRELIAHIKREAMGYTPTANDEFDNALFEARVRDFLIREAGE